MKSVFMAVSASVVLASPAIAQADAPRQATVTYGDLDLSNPLGQAALAGRINRAVSSVCSADDNRNLKQATAAKACWKGAKARAEIGVALAKARSHDVSSNTKAAGH